jgi:hypothetical protein
MRACSSFTQAALSLRPVAIALAVLAVTSVTGRAADVGVTTSARISHACGMILGLDRSEAPYATCVQSLSKSAGADAAAMVTMTPPPPMMLRIACGDIGLEEGTPAFNQCTADLRQSLLNQRDFSR